MIITKKSILKASSYILSCIILFTIVGAAINWIYLIFMGIPMLKDWVTFGSHDSGFLLYAAKSLLALIVVLGFFVGFPILWFFVGKIFGISRAMNSVFITIKDPIYEILSDAILKIANKDEFAQLSNKKKISSIRNYVGKIHKLPSAVKMIISLLISFLPFSAILDLCLKYDKNSMELKTELTKIIDECIEEKLSPPWLLFFVSLIINILAIVIIRTLLY